MRPNLPAKFFDFIITPKYDKYINANFETYLTPNLVTPETLTEINPDNQLKKKRAHFISNYWWRYQA